MAPVDENAVGALQGAQIAPVPYAQSLERNQVSIAMVRNVPDVRPELGFVHVGADSGYFVIAERAQKSHGARTVVPVIR